MIRLEPSRIWVHVGPVALRVGRSWVGVASNNQWATRRRRSADRALQDARRLEGVPRS